MKIPLVAQSTLGASSSPYLKSTSTIYSPFAQTDPFGGSQRIRTSGNGEAIKTSLKEESEDISKIQEDDNRGIRIGGYLGSALKELGKLTKEIHALQDRIHQNEGNVEENEVLGTQLRALTKEVERIVKSDPFSQALDTAKALESSLQSGKISRRSLQNVTSLLGDDFANLVASGAIGSVKKITQGLSDLSGASAEKLLEDEGEAGRINSLARDITSSLRSAKAPKEVKQPDAVEEKVAFVEAPKLTETSFAAAGDVALSLRTYQGKDLLRAVASGFVDDAEDLFQLIIEPPKPDDKDSERKKVEEEQEDLISASKNGLRIDEEKKPEKSETEATSSSNGEGE